MTRGGLTTKVFSLELVAVNPDTVSDKVLTIQPPIVGTVFRDVFASESTSVLAVPKYSGRVFLFDRSIDFGRGLVKPELSGTSCSEHIHGGRQASRGAEPPAMSVEGTICRITCPA
jgi:hypothetical protein